MMQHEFIHRVTVKVLRWDQKVAPGNAIPTSRGLLLFRVHDMAPQLVEDPTTNQFLSIGHKTSGSHLYSPPSDTLFPLYFFNCNCSNCVRQLILKAIHFKDIFHTDNHKTLSEIIAENFLSCFRFPMTHPKSPNIVYVIVIEVWRRFVIIALPASSPDESDLAGTGESSSDHHEEEEPGRGRKHIKLQEELGESFSDHREEGETNRSRKQIKLNEELGESSDIIAQEEDESYSETQLQDILQSLRNELRRRKKGILSTYAEDQLFQVKSAVKTLTFNGRCRKSEEEDRCSVCLEGYCEGQQIVKMPCSHIFHRNCAFQWLPRHGSCPLCRSICTVSIYS